MLRQCRFNPGNDIAPVRFIIGMLELASAAFRKMTARRVLVMRAECQRPIVENSVTGNSEWNMAATSGYAVAARGNAHDKLVHNSASACGMAAARSSAIM